MGYFLLAFSHAPSRVRGFRQAFRKWEILFQPIWRVCQHTSFLGKEAPFPRNSILPSPACGSGVSQRVLTVRIQQNHQMQWLPSSQCSMWSPSPLICAKPCEGIPPSFPEMRSSLQVEVLSTERSLWEEIPSKEGKLL